MSSDDVVRLAIFLLVFIAMAGWESLVPLRRLTAGKRARWTSNLLLGLTNQLFLRLLSPILLVGFSAVVQARDWGLFNQVEVPAALAVVGSVVILDLVIYLQHRLFHAVPVLWRLHKVHHTDIDFDVTTAVRFHPLEICLSLSIKMVIVVLLGAPPLAVTMFEILLSSLALFNHSNVQLPTTLGTALRWCLVTPDMHRVHHSIRPQEHNRNFGFNLSCWDRLLGSYCAEPQAGHREMLLGLPDQRDKKHLGLTALRVLPFYSATASKESKP